MPTLSATETLKKRPTLTHTHIFTNPYKAHKSRQDFSCQPNTHTHTNTCNVTQRCTYTPAQVFPLRLSAALLERLCLCAGWAGCCENGSCSRRRRRRRRRGRRSPSHSRSCSKHLWPDAWKQKYENDVCNTSHAYLIFNFFPHQRGNGNTRTSDAWFWKDFSDMSNETKGMWIVMVGALRESSYRLNSHFLVGDMIFGLIILAALTLFKIWKYFFYYFHFKKILYLLMTCCSHLNGFG